MVVGPLRRRAQKSLNALLAQTAIDRMEIVVVDMAPSDKPALEYAQAASVKYVRRPDLKLWSEGRYEGLKLAKAPIIASIEDHVYPGLCKNRSSVLKNDSRSGPTRKRAGVTGGFAKNMGWRGV